MKPWEPRSTESMPAYAAFAEYRDLGPERSLDQVGKRLGKSQALMERWSSLNSWVSRAKEFDSHLDSIRVAAREQSVAKQARKIMTADEVKEGLTRIAEADIAEVFENDGTFNLVKAKERGVSKLIKSLNFDKDTGKIVKIETYSAHEGYRDMGKTHAIFVDKSETEDKTPLTPDTLQTLKALARQLSGQDLTDEQVKQLMADSFARAERPIDGGEA